jgi:hypothetical protein
MSMSQQERDAKAKAKRAAKGEVSLSLRVRQGEKKVLEELMEWTEDTEQGSVMSACLRYVHALGPDGARHALRVRHEIEISENVAREFRNESLRELRKDPGDEVIAP